MMREFPHCSISHGQGLIVLNHIRECFDEHDMETMKDFVKEELEADNNFYYPSGKTTSRLNLGQICQIAFEIRNVTQKQLDDEESSADEDDMTQENIQKRSEMQGWFQFCTDKVDKIEKVWNRKLENPEPTVPEPMKPDDFIPHNDEDHEKTIEDMFSNFNPNLLMKRTNSQGRASLEKNNAGLLDDMRAARDEEALTEKKTGEYGDNQFWEKNDMGYDLDDLLADMA